MIWLGKSQSNKSNVCVEGARERELPKYLGEAAWVWLESGSLVMVHCRIEFAVGPVDALLSSTLHKFVSPVLFSNLLLSQLTTNHCSS